MEASDEGRGEHVGGRLTGLAKAAFARERNAIGLTRPTESRSRRAALQLDSRGLPRASTKPNRAHTSHANAAQPGKLSGGGMAARIARPWSESSARRIDVLAVMEPALPTKSIVFRAIMTNGRPAARSSKWTWGSKNAPWPQRVCSGRRRQHRGSRGSLVIGAAPLMGGSASLSKPAHMRCSPLFLARLTPPFRSCKATLEQQGTTQ